MPSTIVWPATKAVAEATVTAIREQKKAELREHVRNIVFNRTRQALVERGMRQEDATQAAEIASTRMADDIINGVLGKVLEAAFDFALDVAETFVKTALDTTTDTGQVVTPMGPGRLIL